MAKLEVQIGADSSELSAEISAAEAKIKRLGKLKVDRVKLGLDVGELTADINTAKAQLKGLNKSVSETGTAFSKMQKPVQNGGNTLMQFSRIAQDAPFGIMGIGNNITATAESFGYLSASAGGTGNALKAVASSMMGVGGILLAVSLVTSALTYMSQNGITVGDVFNKLTGNFNEYSAALKKANDEAYKDEGVVKATSNLYELRTNLILAKNGFLDKDKVVNQYNETMGKTTGLVKTLDQVERQLIRNGGAYVKMTLFKAAATLALEQAAKSQLAAEQTRVKKLDEFTNAFLDADLTQTRSAEQYNQKQENLKRQLANRKKEELKISEDAAKANLSIANKFNSDAAKIAKDFNFNFFGDNKAPKTSSAPSKTSLSPLSSSLVPIDNEKIKKDGEKVVKLLGESVGNALAIFKETAIPVQIPIQPIIPEHVQTDMEKALIDLNNSADDLIQNSLGNTFSNLGTMIGESLATGGNVLSAIGQTLIQGLAGFLSDMGGLLIKYGTLAIVKGNLDIAIATGGPFAIAAGVAAIGVGIALKAVGGAIGSTAKGGQGGGGGISTGASVSSPRSSSTSNSSGGFQNVVFEISGQSLIGVLSSTLDKNRRLGGGLRLAN
jgi:hypothetical protein